MKHCLKVLFAFGMFAGVSSSSQASSYYSWGWHSSNCYEFTSAGYVIQEVDRDACRKAKGSYYNWGWHSGKCYEYTSEGYVIQEIDADNCRNLRP